MPREVAEQRYAHGTYARYKLAECRCLPCCHATSLYNAERADRSRRPWRVHHVPMTGHYVVRNRLTGDIVLRTRHRSTAYAKRDSWNRRDHEDDYPGRLVDAEPARRHLGWLARQGVGQWTVARVAGVARSTLQKVASGRLRRVRWATAERILAVTASDADGQQLVDAAHTWDLIACLRRAGWTKTHIARELGSTAKVPSLQLQADRVYASSARKVEALHRAAWREDGRVRTLCRHPRQVVA